MKADTVLRLGLVHDGRVLDERLVRAGDVTVGTDPTCTLVLPASALAPQRVQIVAWPHRKAPRLLAQGLEGRVAAGARHLPLPKIGPGTALTPAHRGKLVVGDSVILFQGLAADDVAPLRAAPVPALRRGRVRSRLDWPLFQALIVSAVLLGGSGGGLAAWWHETGRYYDDLLQSERQAEQLVVAEISARIVRAKPEVPEPSETAEAPDPSALPVEPAPTPVVADVAPARPKKVARSPGSRRPKRAPTVGSVRGKTFLGVLGRPDPSGTVAGLTKSARLAEAFHDTDGGVTVSSKDAVVAGPSAADPPQRERYTKVCADGACVGGPMKTARVKQVRKDDRDERKAMIKVRGGSWAPPVGVGEVAPEDIERVFRRRKSAIQYCYERYLQRHAAVNGVVKIRFTLGLAGRITGSAIVSNSFGDASIARCIADKAKGWPFPHPQGGSVTFAYPFVLEAH